MAAPPSPAYFPKGVIPFPTPRRRRGVSPSRRAVVLPCIFKEVTLSSPTAKVSFSARRGLSGRHFVAWTRRRPLRIFRKEFFLFSLRIVQACFRQRAPLFSCGRSFALRAVFQEAPRPPESEFAAPLVGGANSLCGGPVEKGRGPQGPRHAGPERPLNFSTELRGVGVGRGPGEGDEENGGMKGAGRHRHEGGGGEMACGRRGGRRASRWTERASI